MISIFRREWRCFECGRVAKYSHARDAVCCGRQMQRGRGYGAPEGATRIDMVKPAADKPYPVMLRPGLGDLWEVWALWPGRGTNQSEFIGWLGCNMLDTYEFVMKRGYSPSAGVAMTRQDAAMQMQTIAEGGIRSGTIRA